MRQIIFAIHLLIMLTICVNRTVAAPDNMRVDTSDANESLKDLQLVFDNMPFNTLASYFREYVDSAGIKIKDSTFLTGYSIYKTGFRYVHTRMFPNPGSPPTYTDEIHVQNEREHITVDRGTKMIFIDKRISPMQAIFHLDLLDPQFVRDNVQRMYTIDSLQFKVIKVEFKPESPYLFYALRYDTASLGPSKLSCITKFENGSGSGGYDRIEIGYATYSTAGPIPIYTTDQYYTRINGIYVLKPAYADYEIVDNSAY